MWFRSESIACTKVLAVVKLEGQENFFKIFVSVIQDIFS